MGDDMVEDQATRLYGDAIEGATMTSAPATISVLTSGRIAGQVAFQPNPAHRPLLHLCRGSRLIGSRLAEARVQQIEDSSFVRDFEFTSADMGVSGFSVAETSIVVAASGERLIEPGPRTGDITVEEILQRASQPLRGLGRTYEDALVFGYCAQEIVALMFRDLLGRECELAAMQDWEVALTRQSTIVDVVETLIRSSEYLNRQLSIGSLPGRIFDNDLLYMVDKGRMLELQKVSYGSPIHDLVIDLAPLATASDEEFVSKIFQALLMRSADPDSVAHFVSSLRNGWSRRDIAAGLVASAEFNTTTMVAGFDALIPGSGGTSGGEA